MKRRLFIVLLITTNVVAALIIFREDRDQTNEYQGWSHVFTQGTWLEAYYEPEHIELSVDRLKDAIVSATPYRLAHDTRISEHSIVIQGKAKEYKIDCISFMNNPNSIVMKDDLLGYYVLADDIEEIKR